MYVSQPLSEPNHQHTKMNHVDTPRPVTMTPPNTPKRGRDTAEPECPGAPVKKARVVPPLSEMAKECIGILSEGQFQENFWETWETTYLDDLVDLWDEELTPSEDDQLEDSDAFAIKFKEPLWKAIRQSMEVMLFDPTMKPSVQADATFPDTPEGTQEHMAAHIWDNIYCCMHDTFVEFDKDLGDFDEEETGEKLVPRYGQSDACKRLQVYLKANPRFRPEVSNTIVDKWIEIEEKRNAAPSSSEESDSGSETESEDEGAYLCLTQAAYQRLTQATDSDYDSDYESD